jgi:starch phosphorylase
MVAHTLRTLGPKAQATRMVREYTTELYQPAAVSSRALAGPAADGRRPEYAPARELAAWQDRVRKAWQGIAIEHVEAAEGEQMPGARLAVSAVVALGELTPDDVTVQVVYGRVGDEDELADPAHTALTLESPPDGQSPARYAGEVELGGPGPFGYTVRVLPAHPLLATPAELGLITFPDAPAGLTNGDLR